MTRRPLSEPSSLHAERQFDEKRFQLSAFIRVEGPQQLIFRRQVNRIHLVNEVDPAWSQRHKPPARIPTVTPPLRELRPDETVDSFRRGSGGDHRVLGDRPLWQHERFAFSTQRTHDVEFPLADAICAVVLDQSVGEGIGESTHASDHGHRARIQVRALPPPLLNEIRDQIVCIHGTRILSAEATIISMETTSRMETGWRAARWPLLVAVAPVAFGSTYWVTRNFLPADSPLWGSAIRALPAGVVLLLLTRALPTRAQLGRATILGTLNMGVFFCLVYLSAQLLPSSVAASITAVSPILIAGFAWALLRQRPHCRVIIGAGIGLVGVVSIVGTASGSLNGWGIAASFSATGLSSLGAVLMRRWDDGTPVLHVTSWQLAIGGLELVAAAALFEPMPVDLQIGHVIGFAYVSLIGTALAFYCWFSGFRHLPASVVGVIGLLNPAVGVLLGVILGSETLTPLQVVGICLVLGSVVFVNVRSGRRPSDAPIPYPAVRSMRAVRVGNCCDAG